MAAYQYFSGFQQAASALWCVSRWCIQCRHTGLCGAGSHCHSHSVSLDCCCDATGSSSDSACCFPGTTSLQGARTWFMPPERVTTRTLWRAFFLCLPHVYNKKLLFRHCMFSLRCSCPWKDAMEYVGAGAVCMNVCVPVRVCRCACVLRGRIVICAGARACAGVRECECFRSYGTRGNSCPFVLVSLLFVCCSVLRVCIADRCLCCNCRRIRQTRSSVTFPELAELRVIKVSEGEGVVLPTRVIYAWYVARAAVVCVAPGVVCRLRSRVPLRVRAFVFFVLFVCM
jgi:hypothetical protein